MNTVGTLMVEVLAVAVQLPAASRAVTAGNAAARRKHGIAADRAAALAAGQAAPPVAVQVRLLKVMPVGTGSLTAVVTLCAVVLIAVVAPV
ncbi:MAG: hypothetical protein U1F20_08835 [Lysobacterales bacterium]